MKKEESKMVLESEKLSVVVPVYNAYKYLGECLDSIINQTYKNLEIIIVNDASPYKEDDEICKEYAAKDERIKYIVHETNKGPGGGYTTGIYNATGTYITFVDNDDYLCDNNAYKECIDILNKDKSLNLVFYNYVVGYSDGKTDKSYMNKKYYNKNIKLTEKPIHITIAPWSKVYKLNDIKDNKLTFPEHIGNADLEFWFKYHIAVKPKIYGIDKYFYNYRQNSESIVNNLDKHFMGYISLFNNMFDYYKNKGEQWRNLYVSYLPHLRNIEPYINELDNKKKIEIADNIINILEKINLTEEEFRKNLGFDFYKVFFRNKYI